MANNIKLLRDNSLLKTDLFLNKCKIKWNEINKFKQQKIKHT